MFGDLQELMKHRDCCFKCRSLGCYHRIYLEGEFDELACNKHSQELERYADQILGSKVRHNVTGSIELSREEIIVPESELVTDAELQIYEADESPVFIGNDWKDNLETAIDDAVGDWNYANSKGKIYTPEKYGELADKCYASLDAESIVEDIDNRFYIDGSNFSDAVGSEETAELQAFLDEWLKKINWYYFEGSGKYFNFEKLVKAEYEHRKANGSLDFDERQGSDVQGNFST